MLVSAGARFFVGDGDGRELLDRAEALRPAVGGKRGVELVRDAGALVQTARQHGDDLDEILGQVERLRHDLHVKVVHERLGGIQRLYEALELSVLV